MQSRRWSALVAAVVRIALPAPASASEKTVQIAPGQTAVVRFQLPGEAVFQDLLAECDDIAARPRTTAGMVQTDLVVTATELAALTARGGAAAVQVIPTATTTALAPARTATDSTSSPMLNRRWIEAKTSPSFKVIARRHRAERQQDLVAFA